MEDRESYEGWRGEERGVKENCNEGQRRLRRKGGIYGRKSREM